MKREKTKEKRKETERRGKHAGRGNGKKEKQRKRKECIGYNLREITARNKRGAIWMEKNEAANTHPSLDNLGDGLNPFAHGLALHLIQEVR